MQKRENLPSYTSDDDNPNDPVHPLLAFATLWRDRYRRRKMDGVKEAKDQEQYYRVQRQHRSPKKRPPHREVSKWQK
jgi:hypothetical protein